MAKKFPSPTSHLPSPKPALLAIVGPTASGKSALALKIAKKYGGEIICADSRTIYKGLDVGTAKPSVAEQAGVPHFGLDLVNPDERFSVADFQKLAGDWISDIKKRGKLPIVVGGTGLYVDALLYSFSFAPKNSARDFQNPRHLAKSANVTKETLSPGAIIIGLDPGREALSQRIKVRAAKMKKSGVLEETRWLKEKYGWLVPGASGTFYRALRPFFEESEPVDECFEEAEKLDRQLAKKQRTWFKRNKDVQWFDDPKSAEQFLDSALVPPEHKFATIG